MGATYGQSAWGSGKYSADPNEVPLSGNLAPQIALGGSLSVDHVLAGVMTPSVVFTASMASGPLWEPSELCGDPGWVKTELCDG